MQTDFKAISLSFKSAPVAIREIIALDEQSVKLILERISEILPLQDTLILSTCNRTEVYYTSNQDFSKEIIQLIGLNRGIDNVLQYESYFDKMSSIEAVRYLFRVSMGLEAQVVGDMQIANQVKRAYQWSADANLAGAFLHRLMHTIFFSSKRVAQETAFRDGAASVSYAASELVHTLAENIAGAKILVLGLGEIGQEVCKHMTESHLEVSICNRTQSKAETIGAELGLNTIPFDSIDEALANYDIIISSIASDSPFVNMERMSGVPVNGYKFLIDLSVPRSIAPEVANIAGVSVYNVDEINLKASRTVEKRIAAIPEVELIIDEALGEFNGWARDMEVSPTIKKLKNALEQIRQEEIARHLKNATKEQQALADKLSKGITQKIMKLPVLQLKAACKRGEAETLIDVLNDLFDLEKDKVQK
ncbi:MAG: glutamyl-tRNA reductase [Roseivirga sp.]|nr:glutamyl-tRNA reductase [Roseivirga sp.]